MNITEHNNSNRKKITKLLKTVSVMDLAKMFDVNWYYISTSKANPNYIPRNSEVATKMGYRVYHVSVPHGQAKAKASKRCTIYPTTDPEKIKAMLLEVTGMKWLPVIDTMEY